MLGTGSTLSVMRFVCPQRQSLLWKLMRMVCPELPCADLVTEEPLFLVAYAVTEAEPSLICTVVSTEKRFPFMSGTIWSDSIEAYWSYWTETAVRSCGTWRT